MFKKLTLAAVAAVSLFAAMPAARAENLVVTAADQQKIQAWLPKSNDAWQPLHDALAGVLKQCEKALAAPANGELHNLCIQVREKGHSVKDHTNDVVRVLRGETTAPMADLLDGQLAVHIKSYAEVVLKVQQLTQPQDGATQ